MYMNKFVIKGNDNKDKRILITAGIHGNELTPIYCSYLLSKVNYTKYNFNEISIINSINKDCGDIIKCGDKLGHIIDLDTQKLSDIIFNLDNSYRIICFGISNYVDSNNSICFLQPIE